MLKNLHLKLLNEEVGCSFLNRKHFVCISYESGLIYSCFSTSKKCMCTQDVKCVVNQMIGEKVAESPLIKK